MRHFYKNVVSGLVFWLLFSQSLSLFDSPSATQIDADPTQVDTGLSQVDDGPDEAEGDEGRQFGDFLRLVKRELTGANDVETGRSSSGIFNTTLAFTIPLFSFTLPDRATAGKDYTRQAALSLFGLALVGGLAVVPYVWAASQGGQKPDWTLSGRKMDTEQVSSPFLRTVTDLASRAGFDPQECVLRSICEAYQRPEKYGYLVLPVRWFAMKTKSRTDGPSDYQSAAEFGRTNPDGCTQRYRCAFSLIGAVNYLVAFIYPSSAS